MALRVGRKSLERRYTERTKALLGLASDLPDRPSPDDIHNLRVAARRIQMARRLMPSTVRSSPDSKRFDLALKSVLKATSQLRDMDTLMQTLESHREALPPELMVNLENQRSDAAARANAAIRVLADVPAPDLGVSKVRKKGLSKRLRKRVRKHSRAASALMTDVLNDESKLEDLHSLRKEVKKIRYLLELAKNPPARLSSLVKWQESLGAIHDLDVAISYLEKADVDSKRRAILELQRARHSKYLRFIRNHRSELARALGEGAAPPPSVLPSLGVSPAEA